MRIWFDTEFIEDGKTIDLISIGMVREDGPTLYLENSECNLSTASEWVKENVLPWVVGEGYAGFLPRTAIAEQVRAFAGTRPEFWAYFADYDWVALCQLYGRMIDLPAGWPMYCRDIKQELDRLCLSKPEHIVNLGSHNALHDARWVSSVHRWIEGKP